MMREGEELILADANLPISGDGGRGGGLSKVNLLPRLAIFLRRPSATSDLRLGGVCGFGSGGGSAAGGGDKSSGIGSCCFGVSISLVMRFNSNSSDMRRSEEASNEIASPATVPKLSMLVSTRFDLSFRRIF